MARSVTWMDQPRPSRSAPLPPTRRWAAARATPPEGAICNQDAGVFPFTGSGVTLTVSQCTFANNSATGGSNAQSSDWAPNGGGGGAIEALPGTKLTVLNCTFTGNQANSGGGNQAFGGAICNSPAVTVTISGSQFISNAAIGSGVGAIVEGGALGQFRCHSHTPIPCLPATPRSAAAGDPANGGAVTTRRP